MGGEREERRVPLQDENVDFSYVLRGDAPIGWGKRAASGSVDGAAVFSEPLADGSQASLKFVLNFAVRQRANIEQKVGIVAGRADEHLFDLFRRFVFCVADVEAP